jgi:antitoxin (DNA-binding transcriptional repressor) of toxin-antitoxin stability system
MALIEISIAQAQFLELVERAHGGEEIVLTRDGKPYVQRLSVRPGRPLGFVRVELSHSSISELLEPLDAEELEAWA